MIYPKNYSWVHKEKEQEYDYESLLKNYFKGPTGPVGPVGIIGESGELDTTLTYLVRFDGLIYMSSILAKSANCYRVKFLEAIPPKFLPNSTNGEVWIPKSDFIHFDTLDKSVVRSLKINSIVSGDE